MRQRIQLTGTNRPRAWELCSCSLWNAQGDCRSYPARIDRMAVVRAKSARFPVAIAAERHPFPFRTRKLSPPAPMVLGGWPPGRVGRRRDFSRQCPRDAGALSRPGSGQRGRRWRSQRRSKSRFRGALLRGSLPDGHQVGTRRLRSWCARGTDRAHRSRRDAVGWGRTGRVGPSGSRRRTDLRRAHR